MESGRLRPTYSYACFSAAFFFAYGWQSSAVYVFFHRALDTPSKNILPRQPGAWVFKNPSIAQPSRNINPAARGRSNFEFKDKFYRKVEKVEEGKKKLSFTLKTYSTLRLNSELLKGAAPPPFPPAVPLVG
jgi:hypothetical protein